MRRTVTIFCALAILPLILGAGRLLARLPVDRSALTAEKYGGYGGVLRVWVCEGWKAGEGGLLPWLNQRAAAFERRHEGVYVQFTSVSGETIAAFRASGINPPDAILFPPGLLAEGGGLIQLSAGTNLRDGLAGEGRALPVAMGLYAWAMNRAAPAGAPTDWTRAGLSPACPEDEPYRAFGAALVSLCAGVSIEEGQGAAPAVPGVDLNLPDAAAAPEETPVPERTADAALPDGFAQRPGAVSEFLSGDASACAVGLSEMGTLIRAGEAGRGPEMEIAATGAALFTDQILYFAVPTSAKPMGSQREKLCAEMAQWLLTEESQRALANRGAMSVLPGMGLYRQGPMAQLEAMAEGRALLAPGPFGISWRGEAEKIVREFLLGARTASETMAILRDIL